MGKRWWLVLVLLGAISLFSSTTLAVCDGDGICEPGENTGFCGDCLNAFCGSTFCDTGLNPPETCNSCYQDCGYCDGHSCTSGGQCEGRYCICGICTSTAPPGSYCCSSDDCLTDVCGPWGGNFCYDSDVYHERNCHDYSCINLECADDLWTQRQKVEECGTLGCSGGSCTTCTSHASYSCRTGLTYYDIYWMDSCGMWEDKKEECGDQTWTTPWGSLYCKSNNVYKNQTKHEYSCNAGDTACHETNTVLIEQLVQTCTNGCTNGQCNPGCSNDPPCTSISATGCSLDYVNRWYCVLGGDGCLDQTWETCIGGRCDATTHQCVAGCTSNANCDDNNVCTLNQCTVRTGICTYPADPGANGAVCDYPGTPGIGDGRCNNGVCQQAITCYRDLDGDTYGNPASTQQMTSCTNGWVTNNQDCNDNPLAGGAYDYPGATERCDNRRNNCNNNAIDVGCDDDIDTYADSGMTCSVAFRDGAGTTRSCSTNGGDCNDGNANIRPGLSEACNGIDDNCAGGMDEGCDDDNDDYCDSSMTRATNYACTGGNYCCPSGGNDCNDGNVNVNPGRTEICNNVNDNCDTGMDENCDNDSDQYADGAMTCEGTFKDGLGTTRSCSTNGPPTRGDCDDINPNRNPGRTETCNGIDDDCDTQNDEGTCTAPNVCRQNDLGVWGCMLPATCTQVTVGTDCAVAGGNLQCYTPRCTNGLCNNIYNTGDCTAPVGICNGQGLCLPSSASLSFTSPQPINTPVTFSVTLTNVQEVWAATIYGGSWNVAASCSGNMCTATRTFSTTGAHNVYARATKGALAVNSATSTLLIEGACYRDADGDSYGNPSQSRQMTGCTGGWVADNTDCDDGNGNVNPGATETCNGIDDNCAGGMDEGCDDDNDNYCDSSMTRAASYSCSGSNNCCPLGGNDCNDNPATGGAQDYPGATEICDGRKNNCNNNDIDVGCDDDNDNYCDSSMTRATNYACTGGNYCCPSGGNDCNDGNMNVNPGRTEICNNVNDNCDTGLDENCDGDSDSYANGYMACEGSFKDGNGQTRSCSTNGPPINADCVDTNGNINPGRTEACNGYDDNCDGVTDISGGSSVCACEPPPPSQTCVVQGVYGVCTAGLSYATCNPTYPPAWGLPYGECQQTVWPATEACNGLDDNCDGFGDAEPGQVVCMAGGYTVNQICMHSSLGWSCQCEAGMGWVLNPAGSAIPGWCQPITTWWYDADGDGYGTASQTVQSASQPAGFVDNSADCNDGNALMNPGLPEICTDNLDNDCDGYADEQDPDCVSFQCGNAWCEGGMYTDTIQRRNGLTCKNELVTRQVINSTPTCINNMYCSYTQHITELGRENITYPIITDGTACSESVGGYCRNSVCLAACPVSDSEPGCQAVAPANAILENLGCPSTQTCYRCPESMIWDANSGACENTPYTIYQDDIITTAGTELTITPIVKDHKGRQEPALFRFTGYATGESSTGIDVDTKITDVGTKQLVVTAVKPKLLGGEETIARKTIDIVLTCPAATSCCIQGEPEFMPEGSECVIQDAPGECSSNGRCQPTCENGATPEHSARHNCNDGIDNDCDGTYDCVRTANQRTEEGCMAFCGGTYCDEDAAICDGMCVDTDTDRANCGYCGRACAKDQQCMKGACVATEGCFVACESEEDCGRGEYCVNSGTCEAYCADRPVIQLTQLEQEQLFTTILHVKAFEITKIMEGDELEIIITSLIDQPLTNFILTVSVPAAYAKGGGEIEASHKFEVLHSIPEAAQNEPGAVVRFLIPEVRGVERVRMKFPRTLDPALVMFVQATGEHDLIDIGLSDILSGDDLIITRVFEETEDGMKVRLKLKSGSTLKNLRVPLEIPKCLANSLGELSFNQDNYAIVQDDPLMVWTFDTLSGEKEISFTVPKTIDESCQDQLRAFGLAGEKEKPISPWLPLAIIPLIGIVILFFEQFKDHPGAEQHLTKDEYFEIARRQGQSEDEIERGWHDYKRRF